MNVDLINEALTGDSLSANRIRDLDARIASAQEELRKLLMQRQAAVNNTGSLATEHAYSSVMLRHPGLSADKVAGAQLSAVCTDVPIRWHVMHGKYNIGNNDIIYVTQQHYTFSASIMPGNRGLSVQNRTEGLTLDRPSELFGAIERDSLFSHPHVRDGSRDTDRFPFETICSGNNNFRSILGEMPTPQKFLEFMVLFYKWATYANLDDLWDTYGAYKEILLSSKGDSLVDNADVLFNKIQLELIHIRQEHQLDLMPYITSIGSGWSASNFLAEWMCCGTFLLAFQRVYAAWLLKNMYLLHRNGICPKTHSLCIALRTDIACSRNYRSEMYAREAIYAPVTLRNLLRAICAEDASKRADLSKLEEQIII